MIHDMSMIYSRFVFLVFQLHFHWTMARQWQSLAVAGSFQVTMSDGSWWMLLVRFHGNTIVKRKGSMYPLVNIQKAVVKMLD